MRPAEIGGLEKWIRAAQDSRAMSITIPCFSSADPMVYYSIKGPGTEVQVLGAFWDREREQWVVAGSLDRSQRPDKVEEMRRTIDSIACLTIGPK